MLFVRTKVAAIVPRKLAKHFESTANLPIFCFSNSESVHRVTRAFTLNHPNKYLLKKINSFIRRAMETGHLQKFEDDSTQDKKYIDSWNGPVVLTVEHLSGAIVIYMLQ